MKKKLQSLGISFVSGIFLMGCANQSTMKISNSYNTLPEVKEPVFVELKNGDSYDLTAEYVNQEINGNTYKMLAYNGSIPGPTLKVHQGSEVTIHLKNETDIPTSLHSHGVRLEDKYDGVVGIQQKQIDQDQIFTYKIKFPDVGIFWYHPHLNEPYTQSHGLYGSYWVVPNDKNYWSPVNEEVPLMINDISVQNGRTDSFNPKVTNYALMGEFGNVMLVNGSSNYQKTFQLGEVARFYLVNASNTRVYNLSIPNVKMKLVGGDNGKYEHEIWQDHIVLSPSERAIVEVLFSKSGSYTLQSTNPQNTYNLGTFTISDEKVGQSFAKEFSILRDNKDVIADIDKYRAAFNKALDKSIRFTMEMKGMGNSGQHMMLNGQMMSNDQEPIEWEDTMAMMNAMSTTETVKWKVVDEETKKENDQIHWQFKVGDKVKIKIYNDPNSIHPMQHPIHFHGQRFLVLSTNGVKNTNLVWKDTALIPKGATVEILVDMSNSGKWMAHCHIAEHLSSGMMFPFEVNQ
jgi:FtsP/CotA-like multicopper oxidase with cupredoxin domain